MSAPISETKQIHAVPVISKDRSQTTKRMQAATNNHGCAHRHHAGQTTVSTDQRARKLGITSAPTIAPPPKTPSSDPYPIALLLTSWAIEGNSASSPLAKNIEAACRSITVLISGENRTYRNPAVIAPASCSGCRALPGRPLPQSYYHEHANERNNVRDECDGHARSRYHDACQGGQSERAKLNSIPFRAEAAARSSFGTNSGRIARQDGASKASPAESANVSASSSQRVIVPLIVRRAIARATTIIQVSVKSTSLRRSTRSPTEPAMGANRKNGRADAV